MTRERTIDKLAAPRVRRAWQLTLGTALLFAIALAITGYRIFGEPAYWYPFIPTLGGTHYTAGPLAMSSHFREDGPLWRELPAFNHMQARLAYAARQGEPAAQVAWLHARAGWKDEPAFNLLGIRPNAPESAESRALVAAGYEYDRISRRMLGEARAEGGTLHVGQARYAALLVSELEATAPELLATIEMLARSGVPVVWLGRLPARASGWADHTRRDAEVHARGTALGALVTRVQAADGIGAALRRRGVAPAIAPADGSAMRLRVHRRVAGSEQLLLLFNEDDAAIDATYDLSGAVGHAALLDAESGASEPLRLENDGQRLRIAVPARRTRVLRLASGKPTSTGGGAWSEPDWRDPPRALHPWMRWWWPGSAVEPAELLRELRALHAAGFGGIELQTLTLGLRHDDLVAAGERIYRVGTSAWFDQLRPVIAEARRLGMGVDLTLGSGWSSGGPFVGRHPEQQLLLATHDVEGPLQQRIELPKAAEPGYVDGTNRVVHNTIGAFDANVALQAVLVARINTGTDPPTLDAPVELTAQLADGHLDWEVPPGPHRLFVVYRNATGHNAAGSAYPGALERSPILDHLAPEATAEYIGKLADPWLDALAPERPDAVFVDSFELIGELPWTHDFARSFAAMHGYDVTPWLPLLFRAHGESKYLEAFAPSAPAYGFSDGRGARIREDYEATRERLFLDGFVRPLVVWSQQRGVALRLQAHGGWGDFLDAYALADIPESEGLFAGGSFDFLELASSAAHVAGRRVVSSESFITLGLDPDAADIEDLHRLAGNAFAAGINRTVAHGFAYRLPLRDFRQQFAR